MGPTALADAESKSSNPSVAVIGGGASGLTAAWLLAEDYEVRVFERAPEVGGNWCTVQVDGQNIEMGAVKVFSHNHRLRRMCELMGMTLTLDDVVPGGDVKWDDTFRIDYSEIEKRGLGRLRRGAYMGASFGYLVAYLGLYLGLEPLRRRRPEAVAKLELAAVERATGLRWFPREVRDTVRAFLWMGALTYNDIDGSAFSGLMANVHNNFAGFGRHKIYNIDQGFQGLARAIRDASEGVEHTVGAEIRSVRRGADGRLSVSWSKDGAEDEAGFDHVVFACPPWRAAPILQVPGTESIRARLEAFVNAPNKVSMHDDEAIVGRSGIVQLTVDARAYYASLRTGVRNLWKSYQSHPTPEKFSHPRPERIEEERIFDTDAFMATDEVPAINSDAVQGVENTWYIHNAYHPSLIRNGEQALEQAMGLCERMAPASQRLARLRQEPPSPEV